MKEIPSRMKVAEPSPHEDCALLLVTARVRRIHETCAERRCSDTDPLYELERGQKARPIAAA